MNKREITKKIVNAIVTTTVGYTTQSALKSVTAPTSAIQKTEIWIGSYVIGYYVSEKIGDWTDEKVDTVFDWFDSTFQKTL